MASMAAGRYRSGDITLGPVDRARRAVAASRSAIRAALLNA